MRDRNTDDVVLSLEKTVEALVNRVSKLESDLQAMTAQLSLARPEVDGGDGGVDDGEPVPGQV